ncbi:Benzoate 4-monooxygenase cytochrome P450 [Madurella fahalii]|uniref:Benzoate 4-monooxygenase cytochrome P450 n=1 Tax=Madurella fahalii TaxID=1157608 RepID=A0ABQ0GK74_9PEZI
MDFTTWLIALAALCPSLFIANVIYNLYLHPLAHIPGPFWARVSAIPSWLHAMRGARHIWLWQQFQIYGDRIRPEPNTVLFCDPEAYADIYGMKSNVRRSRFYSALKRSSRESTTLNTIDVAEHAKKRKLLNLCFTEKSLRASSGFIIKHVDRWNELLIGEEERKTGAWTAPLDLSEKLDALVFDIMGDLCFGRSFDIKEPGENPLKAVPHFIADYMKFYYPMCRSPLRDLIIWLKPRGLDRLIELISPPNVRHYNEFVYNSVTSRIVLQEKQASMPEHERRQDMFYFLADARDPATGLPVYREDELRAESSLLIIAGSDTTAVSLSGIFFYLTGDPRRLQKLVDEIRTTFASADDIVHGLKLSSCEYLRACVDEGMRLSPAGPCETPREVLPGGILIKGEYYPRGTIVAAAPWVDSRSTKVFGDAEVFRPERWIVDESTGVTKETVARMRAGFHPFLTGPGSCIGKNLAMTEIMITVARTLHRLDVRRAPGSTLGGGNPKLGWGARDPGQFQLVDAYISLRKGPEVQFRKRVV